MKTILEVAQALNVPKQQVYRCIKRYAIDVHHEAGVMYLDEAAESKLISHLLKDEPHQRSTSEAHQTASPDAALIRLYESKIELLCQQLEAKDRQIAELLELHRNQQILLKQEQDRHRSFWQRLLPAGRSSQA